MLITEIKKMMNNFENIVVTGASVQLERLLLIIFLNTKE